MAAEQLGVGGQAAELKTFYDRMLLHRFRQANNFNRFGVKVSLPQHGGRVLEKRRLESFTPSTTILTEGTPGAEIQGTWTTVVATVSQYGQWAKITDVLELQAFDRVVPEYVENFAETMVETLDILTRNVLNAGTNVQFAATAVSRITLSSGMYLNPAELREAIRTLKRNNAKPVRAAGNRFVVFIHPDAMHDLQADATVQNIFQYAGPRGGENPLFDSSFSDFLWGTRLFESSGVRVFLSAGMSGADIYATLVVGDESYMVVDYESMPPKTIVKPRGSTGVVDPLDQIASVGYKAAHGASILNDNNLVRIEHVTSFKNAA